MSDDSIQRAIDAGQRNADGFTLVKNWCAHVRIERFGGVGMIEQATGLPIGHHNLACDHAPHGGFASWDIRDAALDFYDRNCGACTLRKPVSIPNLLIWVAERDAALAERQKAEDAEAARVAAALLDRQTRRAALRAGLLPASADVIDQIEELDRQRTADLAKRLVETARLAPEAFTPSIVDHTFLLLESNGYWFDEAGLQILAILDADARRLARCAMRCLQRHSAARTAALVLLRRLDVADEELISGVLPTIIRMASPSRDSFVGRQVPKIVPLVKLNAAFPQKVAAGIDALLDGGPDQVSLAACAINILTLRDSGLGTRFGRALISKLVRTKWLPDSWDYSHAPNRDVALDLEEAIASVFLAQPEGVDELLQSFRLGASEAGEVRIFSVYGRVLRSGRFRKNRPISRADRLAFRRLLWEAPKAQSDQVLREIENVIRGDPYELIELAREEIDALLGAAIFMDERVAQFDSEPESMGGGLAVMERQNRRATLTSLRDTFIGWAAHGAAAGENYAAYLDVLKNLPEDRDQLAASMLEDAVAMMDSAAGLNAVLPLLYSALMGISVMRRGAAARAVGEIPWRQRDNLPELLWEAFLTTLGDPYRYVHKSAIRALARKTAPEKFSGRVRHLVWTVFLEYADKPHEEEITLKCIELLADHYLTPQERAGRIGSFIVGVLKKMPAWRLWNEIRHLSRQLAEAEGLVDLLVAILLAPDTADSCAEHVLDALGDLPDAIIYANRSKLARLTSGTDRRVWFLLLRVIEILARSTAWAEAERLASAAVAAIPDTTRERPVRLQFQLIHAASGIENALVQSDWDTAASFAKRWREVKAEKEVNDRERARRPNPFGNIRRTT